MSTLGNPKGVFDLKNSDKYIGSFLKKSDVKEILQVNDNDLLSIAFKSIENIDVIDERQLQKLWYENKIPNAISCKINNTKVSLDELILSAIIRQTFPKVQIERQVNVRPFKMDLKLTMDNKPPVFVEFDGPSHFAISRWGMPNNDPFRKKKIVEDKTGFEVINWAYWIQRCSSNVKAIFDNSIKGYGALWSTKVHFGMFVFEDSANIINTITKRFNAIDEDGYGYFYEGETRERNNPEHPIIERIVKNKENVELIIPKGYQDINFWLPEKLRR